MANAAKGTTSTNPQLVLSDESPAILIKSIVVRRTNSKPPINQIAANGR
jgi:hypothetical protein